MKKLLDQLKNTPGISWNAAAESLIASTSSDVLKNLKKPKKMMRSVNGMFAGLDALWLSTSTQGQVDAFKSAINNELSALDAKLAQAIQTQTDKATAAATQTAKETKEAAEKLEKATAAAIKDQEKKAKEAEAATKKTIEDQKKKLADEKTANKKALKELEEQKKTAQTKANTDLKKINNNIEAAKKELASATDPKKQAAAQKKIDKLEGKLAKEKELATKLQEAKTDNKNTKKAIKQKSWKKRYAPWTRWRKKENAWESTTDVEPIADPVEGTAKKTPKTKENISEDIHPVIWKKTPKAQETKKPTPTGGASLTTTTKSGTALVDKVLDPGNRFLDGIENTTKGFFGAFIPSLGKGKASTKLDSWSAKWSGILDSIGSLPGKIFGGIKSSIVPWGWTRGDNLIIKTLDKGNSLLDQAENMSSSFVGAMLPFWPFKKKSKK